MKKFSISFKPSSVSSTSGPKANVNNKKRSNLFGNDDDSAGESTKANDISNPPAKKQLTKFSTDLNEVPLTKVDHEEEREDLLESDELVIRRKQPKPAVDSQRFGLVISQKDSQQSSSRQIENTEKTEMKAPKYISRMMKTAYDRTKEHQQLIDKKQLRELESEDPDFDPSKVERFVTDSYREHQEEMKRLEQLEREQEEMLLKSQRSGNDAMFYKNLLDLRTKSSEKILNNSEEKGKNDVQGLNAGLNVVAKERHISSEKRQLIVDSKISSTQPDNIPIIKEDEKVENEVNVPESKKSNLAKERSSKDFDQQYEENQREEQRKKGEIMKKRIEFFARRTSDAEIAAMRERYFERRRQKVAKSHQTAA